METTMNYKYLQIPNLTVDTDTAKALLSYTANEQQYNAHCVVLNMLGQLLPIIQYKNIETKEIDYSSTVTPIVYDAIINGKLYYKASHNNYLFENSSFTKYFMPDNVVVTEKVEATCAVGPAPEAQQPEVINNGISEALFLKTIAIVTGKANELNLGAL
jgi:hypothetical protein